MGYDGDEITPVRVIRENFRWLPAIVITGGTALGLLLVAVLVCWRAHVWFWEQNVRIQNSIYQNSPGSQQSDIDQLESSIQAIPGAVDHGQVIGDVNQACKYAARITIMPPGDAPWVSQNCLAGSISPGSAYNTSGN
jgi:hypothetical protein